MADLIKTILVPTDFSEAADAALFSAATFAKKLQSKLILLHVVDIPGYGSFQLKNEVSGTNLEEIASTVAVDRLKRYQTHPQLKGVNLLTKVSSGKVYRTILHEAEKSQVDLIIMGTEGHTGMDKFLMGSNTKKVVQISDIPVLTLKDPIKIKDVKNIVFASSFNQEYSFTFPMIYQFMELFKAKLHLLKVITPSDFESSKFSNNTIKSFASDFLLENYEMHTINAYNIEEGISWFCQQHDIDMIFMETHGRKGLAHLLVGSHTEKMGQKYQFPLFSVKMVDVKKPRGVIFPD